MIRGYWLIDSVSNEIVAYLSIETRFRYPPPQDLSAPMNLNSQRPTSARILGDDAGGSAFVKVAAVPSWMECLASVKKKPAPLPGFQNPLASPIQESYTGN